MKANTRIFGEIDIDDSKIINMEKGMIGFPDLKKFALIYNEEREKTVIKWLQSMDDGDIAFPVMEPQLVKADYRPSISEDVLEPLGSLDEENTFVLVTVTVPKEIEKMTCNLQAPIVINTSTNKAAQMIVEDDSPIRFPIYSLLESSKKKAGE
ncbi:MAG: flagellar assembly protein FliW [Agathobacter sp.]|nr:flagellar assembly protein FliW [Agathobacter sp.]